MRKRIFISAFIVFSAIALCWWAGFSHSSVRPVPAALLNGFSETMRRDLGQTGNSRILSVNFSTPTAMARVRATNGRLLVTYVLGNFAGEWRIVSRLRWELPCQAKSQQVSAMIRQVRTREWPDHALAFQNWSQVAHCLVSRVQSVDVTTNGSAQIRFGTSRSISTATFKKAEPTDEWKLLRVEPY